MSYTPPNGGEVSASWVGSPSYTPPTGGAVTASFVEVPTGPVEVQESATASDGVEIAATCSPEFIVESALAADGTLLMSEDLLDSATAADAAIVGVSTKLSESMTIADALDQVFVGHVADAANASDAIESESFATFVESGAITETYTPSTLRARLIADAARASDAVVVTTVAYVAESAVAGDEVVPNSVVCVREAALVSDEVVASTARTQLVEDVAVARDNVTPIFETLVLDEAIGSDSTGVAVVLVSADTITVIEEYADTAADDDTGVLEAAVASDEVSIQITSVQHVSELVAALDSVSYKQPGAVAWLMNTESGGASWYSNYQFTDIAQVGNLVLAVGPEGLSLHEGALDSGDTVDAGVTWGFTEFGGYDREGNPKENVFKKRVSDFWPGYTSDGVLEASVETYKNGDPVYTYEMPQRDAEQSTNNCIKPGLGLNARYWRIGINNVGGCDFAVDSLIAHVAQSTRRI